MIARASALALTIGLLMLADVTLARQQATFRVRTDLVAVDVSVRDRQRPVAGLTADQFELFDNDVAQKVTDISYGKLPIDVTVVLDLSGSVTGPLLDRLRRATRQLMTDLGKDDRLKLVTFNTRVTRAVDFTNDVAAVDQAIRSAQPGGGSSIWDAVGVTLVTASHPDRRQMVVLFTDGADVASALDEDALLDIARRTNASLFSVIPGGGLSFAATGRTVVTVNQSAPRDGLQTLRTLGTETGGAVLPVVGANADLTETFRRALDEFRTTYVLHFTPTGVAREGFHELRVAVKGRDGLTIKARRGYFF